MNNWQLILLIFSLSAINSCKEINSTESEGQSLDNFATGESKGYATNQCVGTNNLQSTQFQLVKMADFTKLTPADHANKVIVIQHSDVQAVDDASMSALKSAYGALPTETQSLLKAFRVKFRLASNVGALCGFAYSNDSKSDLYMSDRDKAKIDTCWRFTTLSENNDRSLEIVIKANKADIGHYLVRQVGYLYSQYFTYLEGTKDVLAAAGRGLSPAELQQIKALYHGRVQDQDFINMKHKFTVAFLNDLVTPKDQSFGIEKLNYLLGNGGATKDAIVAANGRGDKSLKAYFANTTFNVPGQITETQKTAFATGFSDYVLAEGFDSANCNVAGNGQTVEGKSVNTVERFRGLFPVAYGVWSQYQSKKYAGQIGINQALLSHSRYLVDIVNRAEGGQAGLRLTTTSVVNKYEPAQFDIMGQRVGATAFGADVQSGLPMSTQNFNNNNTNPQASAAYRDMMKQYMLLMAQQDAQNNAMMAASLGAAVGAVAQGIQAAGANAARVGAAQAAAASQSRSANAVAAASSGCSCPGGFCGPGCTCANGQCTYGAGGCQGAGCYSCQGCVNCGVA